MCGIVGIVDLLERGRVEQETLDAMTRTLAHRGPDSCGRFVEANFGLGFRRLKIVDPAGGEQPIFNEDRSVVTVCNGEIFNFPDLKQELEEQGHTFRSRCDVEVLVHLWEEHGDALVDRLNGQFGFAVFDRHSRRLLLARDHFGVNPLFYTVVDDLLIFASEIKAILRHPAVPRRVDPIGLDQVLSFPGLVSPRTLFEGIRSLPAGWLVRVENGRIGVREYWDLVYPECGGEDDLPEEEHLDALDELLRKSVDRRLMSDVPVGLFVSGGIDSSLIAALVREADVDVRREAFSVTFRDPAIDESAFQRIAAAALEFNLHESLIEPETVGERLRQMVFHCECPVKESFNTCILVLAAAAKAAGISVVLAGQGADELFGGYIGYRFDALGERRNSPLNDVDQVLEEELRDRLWGNPDLFYEKDQLLFRDNKLALYSDRLRADFAAIDCLEHPLVDRERVRGRHVLHQRSYLDFRLRLADHLLSDHGDRMVMAHAVEARYPFLDKDLVEYAARVPPDLKIKGFTEKYLVRRMAEARIPAEILAREKFGFFSPGTPWLLQSSVDWVRDLLAPEYVRRMGFFDPVVTESLRRRYSVPGFEVHPHLDTDFLMVVLTCHLLCEQFDLPPLA
jgi:asparagine synthase (glutamine-hydrolysing)